MALVSIIRSIIRARSRGLDMKLTVRNGIIRSFLSYIRPRQLQYILPDGQSVFQRWATSNQVATNAIIDGQTNTLQDQESRLFWVGNRDLSSEVILFFHGGGYVLPLSKGHIEWADSFCKAGKSAGKQICVALLDYSLCPENTYPKQMRQAALALEHILALGYSSSHIMIGGDSAGGHLALSLLSHIMHPYQDKSFPRIKISAPLRACFLVSPLLSLDLHTKSYFRNRHADLLSIRVIRDWGKALFRGSPHFKELQNGKSWGMPLSGNRNWWNTLGTVVNKVYLTGGGEELFCDHIIEFGEVLKGLEALDVQVHIDIKEAHDRAYMDFESSAVQSKSTARLVDWVVENMTREVRTGSSN